MCAMVEMVWKSQWSPVKDGSCHCEWAAIAAMAREIFGYQLTTTFGKLNLLSRYLLETEMYETLSLKKNGLPSTSIGDFIVGFQSMKGIGPS